MDITDTTEFQNDDIDINDTLPQDTLDEILISIDEIKQSVQTSEIYLEEINNNINNINNIAQASFSVLLVILVIVIVLKTFFIGW